MIRYAFYVQEVDPDGGFLVRLLHEDRDEQGCGNGLISSEAPVPLLPYCCRFDMKNDSLGEPVGLRELGLAHLEAGSLVLARQARGWPLGDGSPSLLLGEKIVVLGRIEDTVHEPMESAAYGLIAPYLADGSHHLLAEDDLLFEAKAELAKKEPDEALLVACRDEGGGKINVHAIDHRGSFLFWEAVSGEVDGLFENAIKTPRLWLMYNGSLPVDP